jgi:O-antigen ligase
MAIENVRQYGPLGVGSGEPQSLHGLTTHNFWLQVYGEGGVLATLGILGWLVLPVVRIRQSSLPRNLAWAFVAAMAGLMVHGIFWTQVLNGLRFLTLVYVCLWAALATRQVPALSTQEPLPKGAL